MNLFYKRPLLLALSLFILINAVSVILSFKLRTYLLTASSVLFIIILSVEIFLFLSKSKWHRVTFNTLLCVFLCTASLLSSHLFFDKKLEHLNKISGNCEIVARIEECTFHADYTSTYVATILSINDENVNIKGELSSTGPSELIKGDIICTTATFCELSENNYGFNEKNNNISKGILLNAEFDDYSVIENRANSFHFLFSNIRESIIKRLDNGTARSSGGMIKALLLGDKSSLVDSTSLNFRRMGITHILSISGTHFTVLLGLLTFILSSLGFNKKIIYFVLIPFALFYMGLTGFSESVCRSGIMAIMAYSGFLFGRNKDSYTALAFAVTLILLISPNTVLSVSLWLSFVSTFTIILSMDLFNNLKYTFLKMRLIGKLLWGILTSITVSVLISIVTLPIVAAVFGEISIISPISNLLVVPLFTIVLYLAPFCVLFPNFSFITLATDKLCDLIYYISNFICQADNLLISVNFTFIIVISSIGCVVALIFAALPLKRKLFTLLPLLAGFLIIAAGLFQYNYFNYDKVKVTYFSEGNNDGFSVISHNNALCIDISSGASAPTYKAEYIASQNHCPEIKAFVFTHYHTRHISMFRKLCARTKIQSVYLPVTSDSDSYTHMSAIIEIAEKMNIPVMPISYGEPFTFGDCLITIFEPIYISRSTHPVINLQISSENTDTLYLGSSFYETDFEYMNLTKAAEFIVFGQHSPVTKKEYSIDSDATMVFGSETIAKMANAENSAIILKENSEYEILAE